MVKDVRMESRMYEVLANCFGFVGVMFGLFAFVAAFSGFLLLAFVFAFLYGISSNLGWHCDYNHFKVERGLWLYD